MRHEILQRCLKAAMVVALGLVSAQWMAGCADTGAAGKPAGDTAAANPRERITVLYDAFGKDPAMKKDWGFAALVEVGGKRILFDTGDDPAIFAQNVKTAGIDLKRLDFVVISHRHGDHIAGLNHVLSVNPKVKIYAPQENFGIFHDRKATKFIRQEPSLPSDMRYFDGKLPETMEFGSAFPGANIQMIDKTTEVAPGVTLIAQVSDAPTTKELKELSLAINTPEGIVLVVGCSHPGIESIVSEAAKINPHVRLVAGGFHLVAAQDPAIEKVAASLHDSLKVDWIAPGHCTGEPTFAALQRAFGTKYLYAGVGTVLELSGTPHAQVGQMRDIAMDAPDYASYHALLAQSDDAPDTDSYPTRLAQLR